MKTSSRPFTKPLIFFDSCALVMLFVDEDEPATTIARRLWTVSKEVYSSIVCVGEVLSAFAKKKRCNCLSPESYSDACEKFIGNLEEHPHADVRRGIEILQGKNSRVTSPVIKLLPLTEYFTPKRLSDMAKKHRFEFGDAWHLTALLSGLEAFSGLGISLKKYRLLFVSSDRRFCIAVRKENYQVLDLKLRGRESRFLKNIILGVHSLPERE